jgi:phage pi2 protein 07
MKKTLTAPTTKVLKAFNEADEAGKAKLKELFGADAFPKKAMERIKTWEDVCKELKINPKILPDVSKLPEGDRKHVTANYKLIKLAQALNEGWKPNWNNSSEYKYYPWFKGSGSGLSFGDYVYSGSLTSVGSRLCFKTRELAEYAGKQFTAIYSEFLTL